MPKRIRRSNIEFLPSDRSAYSQEKLVIFNLFLDVKKTTKHSDNLHLWFSSLEKLLLTPEQELIVCHNLENRQTMKINAYAGTGKTTTLIAYAAKRMDESFLYIAYNK